MSKVIGQGLRQQQKSLSERVGVLERAQAQMMVGVQKTLIELRQELQEEKDKTEALKRLNGAAEIDAEVASIKLERVQNQAAAEKDSLEAGVKDGFIVATDKIEEKSVLVGRYLDATGAVQEPGRSQLVMPGIQPDFRAKLLGGAPGMVLDLPNGAKFEVQEVYNVDEAKYAEVQAKREADMQLAIAAAQAASAPSAEEAAPAPESEALESADEDSDSEEG